jgi:uncharacterized glyoxalase superfamily protein PhnB
LKGWLRADRIEVGVVSGHLAAAFPHVDRPAEVFDGVGRLAREALLCVNLESFDECREVYETLQQVEGAELLEAPTEAFWGGGFSWRDPEGNIWDVAWAKGTTFDERGGVSFP